jgi:FeS assembly SUF system protein
MSDAPRQPDGKPRPLHLDVVGTPDKVEELRRAFAADPGAAAAPEKKLNDTNVIDRALDPTKSPRQKAIEDRVIEAVRLVYDPEIPVNIYDLGLVYGIDVSADDRVLVKMTLTAPGCPVAGDIVAEVERRVEDIDEVRSAAVELVWDPPWSKEKMSEAALLELGLL